MSKFHLSKFPLGLTVATLAGVLVMPASLAMADDEPVHVMQQCPLGTGLVWHGNTPSCEAGAPVHGDEGNQGSPRDWARPKPQVT